MWSWNFSCLHRPELEKRTSRSHKCFSVLEKVQLFNWLLTCKQAGSVDLLMEKKINPDHAVSNWGSLISRCGAAGCDWGCPALEVWTGQAPPEANRILEHLAGFGGLLSVCWRFALVRHHALGAAAGWGWVGQPQPLQRGFPPSDLQWPGIHWAQFNSLTCHNLPTHMAHILFSPSLLSMNILVCIPYVYYLNNTCSVMCQHLATVILRRYLNTNDSKMLFSI